MPVRPRLWLLSCFSDFDLAMMVLGSVAIRDSVNLRGEGGSLGRCSMRRFEIVQSTTAMVTSHSGLALVGRALEHTMLAKDLGQIPLRHGIAHADCVTSYVGLLCTGKSDFDAIENRRED